ncbi:hypothetical protein J5N97_018152 [Dioscorea zingiberensis]|uniref:BURP domain-containing protein n=1 Tax=Dioscorea zingiberensis TaxID=325984 RepID=A0A9D5HHD1_9LILI|nr:hypothetical protein J5N97_018152 [Dioscorea zingiberensis]
MKGEEKLCATSLESMVEFSMEKLHARDSIALSTTADKECRSQKYTIRSFNGVQRMKGKRMVACHAEVYPYAVFYCHATKKTRGLLLDEEAHARKKPRVIVPQGPIFAYFKYLKNPKTHQPHHPHDNATTSFLFLKKDLQSGTVTMNISNLRESTNSEGGASFIPREKANSIPFSLSKFHDILALFSIDPDSIFAAEGVRGAGDERGVKAVRYIVGVHGGLQHGKTTC